MGYSSKQSGAMPNAKRHGQASGREGPDGQRNQDARFLGGFSPSAGMGSGFLHQIQRANKMEKRQALDSGKITHTGWTYNGRDTKLMDQRPEHECDVSPWMYFDASGKFLGPDENGLVPTFAEASADA
jgi:hypothetical protein